MNHSDILKFYSRKLLQKEMLNLAKNRETAFRYSDQRYGKRPDILQYENDILTLAKQGVISFHVSEEHWLDPLRLETGMSKEDLNSLRSGYDILFDIDSPDLENSKKVAYYVIEALKFHDLKTIPCKYSGNRGFHILIPFESLPKTVNNQSTNLLFPELPKLILKYIDNFIHTQLEKEITSENKDLAKLDTQALSSRHMFRSVYSIHQKSGLVSIPVAHEDILKFNKEDAKMENIKEIKSFYDPTSITYPEASKLILQALDWQSKQKKPEVKSTPIREFKLPKDALPEKFFPPCITLLLKGLEGDGKKRSMFILSNFFKQTGYDYEQMEQLILTWNQKNKNPLPQNYVKSQIDWHKKQNKSIPPPNCSNEAYYPSIGICHPDNLCKLIKNPVNYTIKKSKFKNSKPKTK